MAQNNYFDEVIAGNHQINGQEFGRTRAMARAQAWYKNLAQKNSPLDLSIKGRSTQKIEPGKMYAFRYDPKTKDKLPYYDVFPLIFPVDMAEGGFYGLNFHYLPTQLRAKLLNALYPYQTDGRMDEKTKLDISYKILKGTERVRAFQPCFKRYLFNHMRSPFLSVYSSEWETALLLPTQRFHKASAEKVWQDSISKINTRPKRRK